MRFSATALLFSLLLPAGAAYAPAQTALAAGSAHYLVYQGDKTVGSSDYTIEPGPKGYTVTSRGKLNLSKFSYSFSNSQKLDTNLNLISNQLLGTVNGANVTFTTSADSTGRQFQIHISANGKQTQNTVDRHQHLVLLPDLDSAAYVLLTRVALQNPPTSWILIPKQNGLLVPSSIDREADVHGKLNGAPVTLQHTTIAVSAENAVNVELFYTPDGQLLEADLPQQNFYVVRDGFKLTDRPPPAAPRAPNAPLPTKSQQSGVFQQGAAPQYPAPQSGYPPTPQQ